MKLYTFYTDTHKNILDNYFLSSFNKTNSNIELDITKFEQKCPSGQYMTNGWLETMQDKINLVIRGIEENWNNYFIHSDCDVQFFGSIETDILNQIEENDICGIDENPSDINAEISCGFFICKGNDRTLSLFKKVKQLMGGRMHDQHVFNSIKDSFVTSKKLNYKYYTVSHSIGGRGWFPGMTLPNFKTDILVHHANWIEGTSNKIKNLEFVKNLAHGN